MSKHTTKRAGPGEGEASPALDARRVPPATSTPAILSAPFQTKRRFIGATADAGTALCRDEGGAIAIPLSAWRRVCPGFFFIVTTLILFYMSLDQQRSDAQKKGNEGILTKSQQMWYVFIAFFFPSLLSHAFRPSFSQCSCALSVEARIGPGGGGEGEFFSASVLGGRGSNRGIRVEGEELFVFFFFVPSSSCSWPIAKSERGGERGRRRRPRRDVARPGTARHRPPRPHAPRPPGPSPCSTGSPPPHARRRGRRGRTGRAAPRAATPALRAVDARILGGRRRAPVGSLARGYLVRFPIMFILFSFLL